MRQNAEEVVFSVSASTAVSASVITLTEAGLREREHLQEWALAHPEIIGPDVMVVAFEFDQWTAAAGPPKDRLDILGLGRDGRLVVAELKRDRAPDTVDMQAVKYAAMASRFTLERLAHYHSTFTQHRYAAADGEQALNEDEASAKLEAWAGGALLPEQLVNPRVVLLAESFPPTVTATAVWLNERGVDLTLMSYHAYRIGSGEIVLTVSQLYPVRDVAHFEVAPKAEGGPGVVSPAYPEVQWAPADMAAFAEVVANNPVALAITDLCALSQGTWVGSAEAFQRAGVEPGSGRGQLGGFALTVRSRFKRSNAPYETQWAAGGVYQSYYRLAPELASAWKEIRGEGIDLPLVAPDAEGVPSSGQDEPSAASSADKDGSEGR